MIRAYEKKDAKTVQMIALECFDKNIAKGRKLVFARFFVKNYFKEKNIQARLKNDYELYILEDPKVEGFIEIQDAKEITNIFVLPGHQKKGYGKQLMKYAMHRCYELDPSKHSIYLDASKEAVLFYEKLGFKNLERMKKVMGVEMYRMEKK